MRLRRRATLLGLLGLSGCGFHPLYGPTKARAGGVDAELASVYVPVIAERSGMLMRQALQQRLEGSRSGVAKRYELTVSPSLAVDAIAIQQDSSSTRVRVSGSGPWTLRLLDPARTVVAQGSGRVLDGYDIANQQYFAADLTCDVVTKRAMEALADQVVQQVAAVLRRGSGGAA